MTTRNFSALAMAALLSAFGSTTLWAADQCTNWAQQTDGSWFRLCTDKNGHRYCERCPRTKGQSCARVSCK